MNTSRRNFVSGLAFGTLAGTAFPTLLNAAPAKPGTPFPDLAKAGLEGTVPDLQGKVVLVDLWASWCAPCKKALPMYAELHKEFAARGVVIIAVSLDENRKDYDAFLKKHTFPFTVARDPKVRLGDDLGVTEMPTSFLIGTDGRIHSVHSGAPGDKAKAKLAAVIEELLKK
jgi:thiol-disulfide isomerase/thioredoxin